MARINLLPWREWERERRKKEFFVNLGGVVLFGGLMVFLAGWSLDGTIENQQGRNQFLQTKIKVLDAKIAEIASLKKDRKELLDRMRVIQELQGNRPIIVHVFDELVRTLSKGVHYRTLEMQGNELKVAGTAESNNRISSLMRNLDESGWFAEPNLRSIKEDPRNSDYGELASTFDLTFTRINPTDDLPGGDSSAGED